MAGTASPKNTSEVLFEEYLKSVGLNSWAYEAPVEGKKKRPDYQIQIGKRTSYFDVKEFRFDAQAAVSQGGAFDPYQPIRQKINEVRDQFREYKEHACCLVLFNVDSPLVFLDDWSVVMGAMLGDLGYQFAVDKRTGKAVGDFTYKFASRGKMIDHKHMKPQNTTISAVIALDHFPLGQRRLSVRWKHEEQKLKRSMDWIEFTKFAESLKTKGIDAADVKLRVIVYENPYARMPLSRELFVGSFDERFGPEQDHIVRVFAGSGVNELEAEEAAFASAI